MLLNEDCLEAMQKLIDDGVQVDSIVTDPPYHLQSIVDRFKNTSPEDDTYTSEKVRNRSDGYSRLVATGFMGQEWDGGDIAFCKETWELALKLLKPGGHLLAFSASRNYHRMAVAVEDAGFEIRDQIMWLYGSGFPKSLNVSKAIDKSAGATPTIVKEGDTVRRIRPGADQNKDGTWEKLKDRTYTHTITKGTTPEAQEWEGWGTALKPAHEPIVLARKPFEGTVAENVLKHGTGGINIDGCRVKGKDNPVKWTKPRGGIWKTDSNAKAELVENEKGRFPANVMHDGLEEEWARYFYSPKTNNSEKGEGNTHPTVKPQELMKYLCRLVTPKGGTVLDPFMGSGSTGMAAKDEGFKFIGIEKEKEYFEIAEKRIQAASPLMEFI